MKIPGHFSVEINTCPNESALLATILADGTNLGLSRMAAASEGVTRDQLMWTHDAYIREDTYRAALASIINAHHRLPFSAIVDTSSTPLRCEPSGHASARQIAHSSARFA